MPPYGKVAVVAVVGNEDGAHHCHAEIFQALNDVGYTIPPGAGTYWVGEAMASVDYTDLDGPHEKTQQTTEMLAANAAHLVRRLKADPYPGVEQEEWIPRQQAIERAPEQDGPGAV